MCTVTFVPTGTSEFIFTSNRDEFPVRSAIGLVTKELPNKQLLFPKDPAANGTWICISNTNQLICILNGAFTRHNRKGKYRLSRGIMALKSFEYNNAITFFKDFNFMGIEPFTMVIYDDGSLYELRWDEKLKHVKKLDTKDQHLWASYTLYSEEWQIKRQQWFANWKSRNPNPTSESILDFHNNGGEGNQHYDVKMYVKGIVQTTSITSIENRNGDMKLRYENLVRNEVNKKELESIRS